MLKYHFALMNCKPGSSAKPGCHNAEEELSFKELQEQLRMPKEDLTRVLHSLSCAKYKVIVQPVCDFESHRCTVHRACQQRSEAVCTFAPSNAGFRQAARGDRLNTVLT